MYVIITSCDYLLLQDNLTMAKRTCQTNKVCVMLLKIVSQFVDNNIPLKTLYSTAHDFASFAILLKIVFIQIILIFTSSKIRLKLCDVFFVFSRDAVIEVVTDDFSQFRCRFSFCTYFSQFSIHRCN